MSSATEIVNAFMQALETKEYARAGDYLSDSFFFIGFTPRPLTKSQFLEVMSRLAAGFPDLSYTFHGVYEDTATAEGTPVRGTVRITGTQTDSFTLSPLGLAPIPQTARSIALPEETWEYLIRDNAIASIRVDHVPGGGIEGLLSQLGISDPIIQ
jgi:predicted ester cyclase